MEAFYSTSLLGVSTYVLLWSFLVYSFLGVLVEMLFCLLNHSVLELRVGLLFLPLRPLYGFGGVACTILLQPFVAQPMVIFAGGLLILSVVEFIASYVMDKRFGAVTWDYRHKLLSVQGRICLAYSVCWGLLGMGVVYVLDPFLSGLMRSTRSDGAESALSALLALTLLSGALTWAAFARIHNRLRALRAVGGRPHEPAAVAAWERLIDTLVSDRVMINSFPRTSLLTELGMRTQRDRAWIRVPDPLTRMLSVHHHAEHRAGDLQSP